MAQDTLASVQRQLADIARQVGDEATARQLEELQAATASPTRAVGVVGSFGRGKSTLLNALLERSLLPTALSPNNRASVRVRVGSQLHAAVRDASGQAISVTPVADYLSEAIQRDDVRVLEIEVPSNTFPLNTQFIEVPGLGETNPTHREAFQKLLPKVNTLIFVLDGSQGLSADELSALASLPPTVQYLIIALNKLDMVTGDERSAAITRAHDTINGLGLAIHPQVFAISARQILDKGYDSQLQNNWEAFKHVLQTLVRQTTSAESPAAPAVSVETLLAAANQLEQRISAKPAAQTESADTADSLALINRVISDQANDIRQMVKDSFEVFVYQLQTNAQAGRTGAGSVESELNKWIDSETQRLSARFDRLYSNILEDARRTLGQSLELKPEMLPISRAAYTPVDVRGGAAPRDAGSEFRDLIYDNQLLVTLGSAAAIVVGIFLSSPLQWVLYLSGGAGLATTFWIVQERRSVYGGSETAVGKIEMPEGIERNIAHNIQRLQDYIRDAFSRGTASSGEDDAIRQRLASLKQQLTNLK